MSFRGSKQKSFLRSSCYCDCELIAFEKEELAYDLYPHTDDMFYCSSCKCHLKGFFDFSSKCRRCRRTKKSIVTKIK